MSTLLHTAAILVLVLAPRLAAAQYKNSSFGLDVGGWLIQKPSVVDTQNQLKPPDKRPLRISNGVRLGGESNFKMADDRFWFVARVNAAFLQFPEGSQTALENDADSINAQYDYQAREELGTLFGVEGSIGVRYLFATDYVRPYMQVALSYLRLMSFSDSSSCDDSLLCGDAEDSAGAYLPHPNVGGIHLQPGVELIFTRDIAFHLFMDLQRFIVFNTDDNNSVVLGAGLLFFM